MKRSPRLMGLAPALVLLAGTSQAVHMFKGFTSKVDLERAGITDKKGTVIKRTMLVLSTKACNQALYDAGYPFSYSDLPDATHEFAQIQLEPKNELVSLFKPVGCARSFVYLSPSKPLKSFERLDIAEGDADARTKLDNWFWAKQRVEEWRVENDLAHPVELFWEARDQSDQLHRVMHLEPGKSSTIATYIGHSFIIKHAESGDILARRVVRDEKGFKVSTINTERFDTEILQRTPDEIWVWRGRRNTNIGRIRQNERQPPATPLFTPVGFKKMRFPPEAFKVVKEYHEKNLAIREPEGWSRDDTHVNFWDSHTTMNHLPDAIKNFVFDTFKPILEEWSGAKLRPTSCYGIRRYINGSWLRDHVDIGTTHIISAIMNVDQRGLDRDWLLQILDHDGNRHYVTMAPGDIVLYESASAIHGRPQALLGKDAEYYNVFTHFAPVDYKGSEQDMDGWEVEEEEIESDTDEGALFENLGLAAEQ